MTEITINDYLNNTLKADQRSEVEEHLKDCDKCLERLLFAYEAVSEFKKTKSRRTKMNFKKNIWLIGAIIAFGLSFLVSRFFIQLLVATILLGSKWIFDSVNARILIMIYDAWKKGGEKEASRIFHHLNR